MAIGLQAPAIADDGLGADRDCPAGHVPMLVLETEKSFQDVVDDLEYAITERNLRITGRNTVGEALRERGHEGYPDVEVIHFCNLENAREVLDMDMAFIAQMPCRVTVHEADGRVTISMLLLPEDHRDPRVNEFARRMNAQLREIAHFGREF